MTGYLYRVFDASDVLIYVGITSDVERRMWQHRQTSWWAPQTTNVTTEEHTSMREARQAEVDAIRDENPRWNIGGRWVHRATWDEATYRDFILAAFHAGGPDSDQVVRAQRDMEAAFGCQAELPELTEKLKRKLAAEAAAPLPSRLPQNPNSGRRTFMQKLLLTTANESFVNGTSRAA